MATRGHDGELEARQDEAPASEIGCGLSPGLLLAYYGLVCAMSGYILSATESVKALMRMRGIFEEQGLDQERAMIDATTFGLSASIAGAVVGGFLNDWAGPRITAITGQLTSIAGCLLLFLGPKESMTSVTVACCLIGATYACVSISHTSIASLFPGNATLAITVVCIGNDLSLGVPVVLGWVGGKVGVEAAMVGYCCVNAGLAFLEFFLVPPRPFSEGSLKKYYQRGQQGDEDARTVLVVSEENRVGGAATAVVPRRPLSGRPLWKQFLTFQYIAITILTCYNQFRKTHYAQFVGIINHHIADVSGLPKESAENMVGWYKMLLPAGMLAAFMNGALTNRLGIYAGAALINTWGTCLCLVSSIPILQLQWLAILFYCLFSGFIYGLMYAFLGGLFGFENMGVLQAVLKIFCGMTSLMISPWTRFVAMMPSVLVANRILTGIGVAMYAIPVLLYLVPLGTGGFNDTEKGCVDEEEEELRAQSQSRVRSSLAVTAPVEFDPTALRAMARESLASASAAKRR